MTKPGGADAQGDRSAPADRLSRQLMARAMDLEAKEKKLPFPCHDEMFAREWPMILEYLNWRGVKGLVIKDSAVLQLRAGDGVCEVELVDHALKQSMSVTAVSFILALTKLDRLMGSDECLWVHWRKKGPGVQLFKDGKPSS